MFCPAAIVAGILKQKTMLTVLLTIALDTTPIKPLPVLLPRPVQSETKQNDKSKSNKTNNADRRILGVYLACLVGR